MTKLFVFIGLVWYSLHVQSQSVFYTHGTIKYSRKTNAFRLTEGSWMNQFFQKTKFQTDTFTLQFDENHSLYFNPTFDAEADVQNGMYWAMSITPSKSNIVYKNLKGDSLWAIRDLFEERILISDSFRNVQWKITNEVREIAGFACHKAVGILYDSMYIVAFYTDQIISKSGPETFGNLPGMVLGLAIPRLYTTWMAIDFTADQPEIKKPILPKKKNANYNWSNYYPALSERFKDWGNMYKTLMVWMWGI